MITDPHLHTEQKRANEPRMVQRVWVYLLLLPIVLFTLSSFTFLPRMVHAQSIATSTPLPLTIQMSALHPRVQVDDGCSDVITLDQISWSGIRLFINDCALQHLSALVATFGAFGTSAALLGVVSSWCFVCAPIAAWIAALAGGATAGLDYLEYDSHGCGGVFVDISWTGGIQVEPACSTSNTGS